MFKVWKVFGWKVGVKVESEIMSNGEFVLSSRIMNSPTLARQSLPSHGEIAYFSSKATITAHLKSCGLLYHQLKPIPLLSGPSSSSHYSLLDARNNLYSVELRWSRWTNFGHFSCTM